MSLASAGLAGWLSYSAQPNQVMTVMMLAIAAMATLFGLAASFVKTENSAKILLAFSGLLLAVGAGAGLLLGALSSGHLTTLFLAEWVIVAILMAILSRTVGVILAGLTLLPLGWVLWRGYDIETADLVLYFAITIVPLTVGLLLPRIRPLAVDQPSRAQTRTQLPRPAKPADSSTNAIVNAMSEGVITLNRDGVITLMNPAAEKISGWSKQDALNLNYKSVLNLVDKTFKQVADADSPIAQAMSSNAPTDSRKLLLETKSEKRINLSIIVTPIDGTNGGTVVVFRDITNELAEESAQTEFISTASHEMRTPVASIEGYLGLALNPNTAQIDDKAREFITKAHESAEHLGQLFQDLLDITKADDGLLQSSPEPINLADFAGDVVEGLRHKASERSLQLEFAPKKHAIESGAKAVKSGRRVDPTYYVRVDKNHLREIIANLTENAIKYTLEGAIKVDIAGDNQHVVLSFADTGIGIPAEDAEHLFQKFYRVDNSDTREIGGTGLGLYLVRKLVDTMGGRIWVESEYGKGSTFFVQLDRLDSITAKQQLSALAITKTQKPDQPSRPTPAAPAVAPTASPTSTQTTPQTTTVAPTAPAAPATPRPAPTATSAPAQPPVAPVEPPAPTPQTIPQQPPAAPVSPAAPATARQTVITPPQAAAAQSAANNPAPAKPAQPSQPQAPQPQAPATQRPAPAPRRSGAVDYRPTQINPAPRQSPSQAPAVQNSATNQQPPPTNQAG